MADRRFVRLALVVAVTSAVAGCSGASPCMTTAHDDGSYTLALDGLCLEGVTADHLVGGGWQAAGTDLVWQPAASGGLTLTLSADAPAQALELAIPDVDVDEMFQQGYQSWSFAGTVAIPLMVALDDDGRAAMKPARTGSSIDEVRGVSFHSALFRKGDAGPVLVIAALSAGRAVTGIAATRTEASAITAAQKPGLVLADVQLADGSSGLDAVNDILRRFDIPVIFITAFPGSLLTGGKAEPAFLVVKPFREEELRAVIGQALFFHTPQTAQPQRN